MGVSLYYHAKRARPLSAEDTGRVKAVVERYNEEFRYKKSGESFCLYDQEPEEPEYILRGSTKLPAGNPMKAYKAGKYWIKCLNELRRMLPDADWSVSLEEDEMVWNEEKGWMFSEN